MSMRNLSALLLGLALCVCLPAAAGDGEDGFFIGIEARAIQPSGLPSDYALNDGDSDGEPEGNVESVDYSSEISPRLYLGWMKADGGSFGLSYWNYDEDETESVTNAAGGELWDLLYPADDALEEFNGTATGTSVLEAEVIDLTYGRPIHNDDKVTVRWYGGLRMASLDYGLNALYDDGLGFTESVTLFSEAEGFGLTGGVSGILKLTDKWMFVGNMQASFLAGDVDATNFSFDNGSGIGDPDADILREQDRVLTMIDVTASLVWKPADAWYIWLSYELSQWNNMIDTILLPDDVTDSFLQTDTTDVTWDGASLGVGFQF